GGGGYDAEGNYLGIYGSITDDTQPTPAEAHAAELNAVQGEMGLTDLAGQGLTLGLSDEAAGVGTAIGQALTGDFNLGSNYRLGRDAARIRLDEAREQFGGVGTAAEIVGGGALGRVAGANSLLQTGRSLAARGTPVTRAAIQSQLARGAALEGAAAGGVGGFGYGEGLEGSS